MCHYFCLNLWVWRHWPAWRRHAKRTSFYFPFLTLLTTKVKMKGLHQKMDFGFQRLNWFQNIVNVLTTTAELISAFLLWMIWHQDVTLLTYIRSAHRLVLDGLQSRISSSKCKIDRKSFINNITSFPSSAVQLLSLCPTCLREKKTSGKKKTPSRTWNMYVQIYI